MDEMDSDRVNFVLVGDGNYIMQLSVVITSILLNLAPERKPRFFVFVSGAGAADLAKLEKVKETRECELVIIDMDEYEGFFRGLLSDTFTLRYISFATYFRLMMFSILPDDVEKCFYVDGDMIVDSDLSEMYDGLRDDCLAKVVVDVHSMQNRHSILSHLYQIPDFAQFAADPMKAPYFNAGFFLLNVRLAKKLGRFEAAIDFLKRVPNPPYADQDTLNAILGQAHRDKLEYIDPAYNVFCDIDHKQNYNDAYYPEKKIAAAFERPMIYHFAGGKKPWLTKRALRYWNKWFYYHIRSPFWETAIPLDAQKNGTRSSPGFRLAHIDIEPTKWEIRLFEKISCFKIRERPGRDYVYLFDCITLDRIVKKEWGRLHFFLSFIPFLWVTRTSSDEWIENPDAIVNDMAKL